MDQAEAPVTSNGEVTLIPGRNGGRIVAPFAPGQSGNPRGRPTDTERMLDRLVRRHKGVMDDAADALAAVLRDPHNRHWLGALKEALDRTEGTVQQSTHHHVSTDRAIVTHAPIAHAPSLPEASVPTLPTSEHGQLVPTHVASSEQLLPVPARDDACVPGGAGVQASWPDALGTPSVGAGGTGGIPYAQPPNVLGTPCLAPPRDGADS